MAHVRLFLVLNPSCSSAYSREVHGLFYKNKLGQSNTASRQRDKTVSGKIELFIFNDKRIRSERKCAYPPTALW